MSACCCRCKLLRGEAIDELYCYNDCETPRGLVRSAIFVFFFDKQTDHTQRLAVQVHAVSARLFFLIKQCSDVEPVHVRLVDKCPYMEHADLLMEERMMLNGIHNFNFLWVTVPLGTLVLPYAPAYIA